MRLTGECALVTGSTSGIGQAIAIHFAREGAAVVVTGRDAERGKAVIALINSAGGRASFVAADLGEPGAPEALINETVESIGGLTVLVNNAVASTAGRDGPVEVVDPSAFGAILNVNLVAPAALAGLAIPHMRAAGHGSIINISSRAGERASRGLAAYVSSKGGLNALTRSIAVDYAADNIRCNTISPGYVLNDRRDATIAPERRTELEGMHLTRLGVADDIAYAAVYLASAESEFVTGVNLPLDGGGSAARGRTLG
jgi:NAD(P)-dependent dehydrogenase (short-subunit alcohol dehydrogenase family)